MSLIDFLKSRHPTYTARAQVWQTNERRFRGGAAVLPELAAFDWEKGGGREHLNFRKSIARYINLPEALVSSVTGTLVAAMPQEGTGLSFGELGTVARAPGQVYPSRAEELWYAADGTGATASQWVVFWADVIAKSMVTGHRWLMVEAPTTQPLTRADELRGLRPYLVHLSPLQVTNWHYEDSALQWLIVSTSQRKPAMENGRFIGNAPTPGYRLYVRQGVTSLGAEYQKGGVWDYDEKANLTREPSTLDVTGGEIPAWIHYYRRDADGLSQDGVFQLGQAAVAHMNLSSAADFDCWDAAQSVTFIAGVSLDAHAVMVDQLEQGSRRIPIPADATTGTVPTIVDGSQGAVIASVFESRLAEILHTAREAAAAEASGTPDSSGRSKEATFEEIKAPRLSLLAGEIETSQNTAIHYLERRYGYDVPTGAVRWPRSYSLRPVLDRLDTFLSLQTRVGITIPSLATRALMAAADETGLLGDDAEREAVRGEIETALAARAASDAADRALATNLLHLPE